MIVIRSVSKCRLSWLNVACSFNSIQFHSTQIASERSILFTRNHFSAPLSSTLLACFVDPEVNGQSRLGLEQRSLLHNNSAPKVWCDSVGGRAERIRRVFVFGGNSWRSIERRVRVRVQVGLGRGTIEFCLIVLRPLESEKLFPF